MNVSSVVALVVLFSLAALAIWRLIRKGAPCSCGCSRERCACTCGCGKAKGAGTRAGDGGDPKLAP